MFKNSMDHKLAREEMEKMERRLSAMCSKLGFHCTQVNGQRICTSVRYPEKPNVKGTEIFIGKIPRKIFEDQLIPLFMRAGELYQFRLMLDFSFRNRGFAFATYTTVDGAERAIAFFDDFEIVKNTRIGVFKSVDNCRLFFGNIPQQYDKDDVARILKENLIDGISDIIMYKDLVRPELNRGYVFVEFVTHRDAAMAKKQLYPGCLIIDGQSVFVDWADPIPDVDSRIMAKVTILFIHHIPVELNKEELSNAMSQYMDIKTVVKIHKQLNYAFVHFCSREAAEKAKEGLKALPFPDVKVEWARPREYSKQQRLESPPTHFCLSLPPRMRRHYQQYINTLLSETSSNDSQQSSSEGSIKRSVTKKQEPLSQMTLSVPKNDTAVLNSLASMRYNNRNSENLSCEAEIIRKIEGMQMQQPPMISQRIANFSRTPTTLRALTPQPSTCLEEPPNRNPLIGLPITLIPTRQRATPPPMVVSDRSKYNDVMYPNSSCRNAFYQPFFRNTTMFTSREPCYPQQSGAPMITSGRSTPVVQNHAFPSVFNPLFEYF
ncbi:probable RNA-binding protein 46 isoform X2 [Harmonia axyridis]|uniref:probable RNA-binding protein 46 isoform X2 n=1 Tax=Harmonia axyridis TaxID=115357 RepID=UPI001E278AD2|nr:probable RNA-binding protein 46 isoform X2 [Harmonia axyridis]